MYLELPAALPDPASRKAAPRRIGFGSLYNRIKREIEDSGYKSVSVEEFMRIIQSVLSDAGKEYDEISIGE